MPTNHEIMTEQRERYVIRKEMTHAEYYRWLRRWLGVPVRCIVRHIGADKIRASRDEHFNDIPLPRWDLLHPISQFGTVPPGGEPIYLSLSDTVCVAKQAARDWLAHEAEKEAPCRP